MVLAVALDVGVDHVPIGHREALAGIGLNPYIVGGTTAELMLAGIPTVSLHDTRRVCGTHPTD